MASDSRVIAAGSWLAWNYARLSVNLPTLPFWLLASNTDNTLRLEFIDAQKAFMVRHCNVLTGHTGWIGRNCLVALVGQGQARIIENVLEAYAWECILRGEAARSN